MKLTMAMSLLLIPIKCIIDILSCEILIESFCVMLTLLIEKYAINLVDAKYQFKT